MGKFSGFNLGIKSAAVNRIIAKTHIEVFDKLLDAYDRIGDAIPGLLFYKDLFREHEIMRVVMQDYYSDILKFHGEAIKVFQRSKFKNLLHEQQAAFRRRETGSTGQWIFEEQQYISWADVNNPGHSILYINGIPGAGSTPNSVAYFYFKHMRSDKNNHKSFLRAVLSQLINQDVMMSQEFSEELLSHSDERIQAEDTLELLTKRALEEYGVSFLLADGLDECSEGQAESTVKWLLSLVNGDESLSKTRLRIILSAQRTGLLDNNASIRNSIRLESSKHKADIEQYCSKYAKRFGERFAMTKSLENSIVTLVTEGADGKYTANYDDFLFNMVSLAKLKKAITPEVFPKELNAVYERITESINNMEHETKRDAARRILGLLVAADRDLKWREIQSIFCIDSSDGTIDPDERLGYDAKQLCGSLVDVQTGGTTSAPERVFQIVHNTARRYLIGQKLVNECLENARLLCSLIAR
ncbi:Zinc finger protein [Colletotrichum sp. SAR11_239]|nr:Zinc finger protein [Colletotrichum sp. SAR11_239]